jgi:succinate dehydrogenase/fumarate reductase flavoprotein subunit
MQSYDKFALAESRGAYVASAPTIAALLEQVARWGYDADRIAENVDRYNSLARNAPEKLSPPSAFNAKPIEEAPFFALEVQSTITFAYGGVQVDAEARVLRDGRPVPGLYATGADIGGIFTRAYAGSLSRGLVFGRRAALTAASTGRE